MGTPNKIIDNKAKNTQNWCYGMGAVCLALSFGGCNNGDIGFGFILALIGLLVVFVGSCMKTEYKKIGGYRKWKRDWSREITFCGWGAGIGLVALCVLMASEIFVGLVIGATSVICFLIAMNLTPKFKNDGGVDFYKKQ